MSTESTAQATGPRWQPLERIDRRVLGVLIEKAKTTPDNYPLSLNALVNGCNQKSNRYPQMELDEEQVFDALEKLRKLGATALIEGDGRVDKFRHLAYDWLGVDKFEIAVMGELLLRGAQSIGELRARAARMEKIPGIGELRPIVESLRQKKLITLLTPPGRGCVLTHSLYQDREMEKLRTEHGNQTFADEPLTADESEASPAAVPRSAPVAAPPSAVAPSGPPVQATPQHLLADLRREMAEFREELGSEVAQLRAELDDLKQQLGV